MNKHIKIHSYGQVPTVELDGQTMIESTAICLALAERHPEAGLIPQGRELRDRFWQSVNLSVSTLEIPVVMYILSKRGFADAAWWPARPRSLHGFSKI